MKLFKKKKSWVTPAYQAMFLAHVDKVDKEILEDEKSIAEAPEKVSIDLDEIISLCPDNHGPLVRFLQSRGVEITKTLAGYQGD
jgi:hypothetical protein